MPRQPRTIAADIIDAPSTTAITPEQQQADAAIIATQNALAAAEGSARDLARQLGYDGSLTPGAIEDEIRFYQTQSVMSLLECGKRLLLLKELTPRGEFEKRVEMLGFAKTTAWRFMTAARKAYKSSTVELLSGRVKNAKAFLELVTHDDDADIEAVAQLDDIERMSASQLRAALREAKAERERLDAAMKEANQEAIDAKVRAREAIATARNWPKAFEVLEAQRHASFRTMHLQIDLLEGVCGEACKDVDVEGGADGEQSLEYARQLLAQEFVSSYDKLQHKLDDLALLFDRTLGALGEAPPLMAPDFEVPPRPQPLPTDAERDAAAAAAAAANDGV